MLHASSQAVILTLWVKQELDGKLKIVKVEADPNPGLVEKYKVTRYSASTSYLQWVQHSYCTMQLTLPNYGPCTTSSVKAIESNPPSGVRLAHTGCIQRWQGSRWKPTRGSHL